MVSSRGLSALVCVAVGIACMASVFGSHGDHDGAAVAVVVPPAPPAPDGVGPVAIAGTPAAVDTELPTGSIAPGSALHVPNPAAYRDAAGTGSSLVVTGAEAINYLAGNTLRWDGAGTPLHFTSFASRGLVGEGDDHSFIARRWDRERSEFCEPGRDGATLCRGVSILLDGQYEFPGARLGSVTLAAAAGAAPVTAVLVKGNMIHIPEHIPFLDSDVDVSAAADLPNPADGTAPRANGGDPLEGIAGHAAAVLAKGDARGRQVVYYAKDNRRLALQRVQLGTDKAVQVTVGHWRAAKGLLCQTRATGEAAQACFKAQPLAGGGVRLDPTDKSGEIQSLTILRETGVRDIAQD